MNATCTQCQTVFRVDPAKVPEAGVRARCSVCAGVFWVRREAEPAAPAPAPAHAPAVRPAAAEARSPAAPSWAAPPAVAPAAPPPGRVPPFRPASPPAPAFHAPAPSGPATPAAAAPAPPAVVTRHPATSIQSPAAPPARRPTNPFLSQDPEARARRLARALVSDIVVYHPAKRRDALRDGSLKLLFEEEIRKSWDEYVDQVGRELADSTTFFTDALNEILADGQPVFP
jgi:predicted Zn finger-like uncharacterized protein